MASKYQVIVSVAEHTANDITKNGDTWMRFLTTAASNYKYRFKDQLLIYAQKPDAVACAEKTAQGPRLSPYAKKAAQWRAPSPPSQQSKDGRMK